MRIVDHQNTKIVATVGPACNTREQLLELITAGVNVFRLNFSHGTHEDHQQTIDHIVEINQKYRPHVGILADIQGPKLRVGEIEGEGISLDQGEEIWFLSEPRLGTKDGVYMSYEHFAEDVKHGEKVLVDDGKLVFEVIQTEPGKGALLRTMYGGVLKSNKGVNLPDTKISLPCLTEKDLVDLDFILTQPVNWIALSFVRSPKDIKDLRKRVDAKKHPAKLIAKIEKPEAIKKIDKIIKHSNGIMIARGDLGVEVAMEWLPHIQKTIINKCIQRARPVIVATQMMESMISNPSPTRAEITDVANAVLDGADALMLSGETAVGRHPTKVVEAMNLIIDEAENNYSIEGRRPIPAPKSSTFLSDAICFNAAKVAEEVEAKAIIGMTTSGYTAFKVSSYRPDTKIYIFSEQHHMLSTLNLVWGVRCYYYDKFTTTDETNEDVLEILKSHEKIEKGDVIINTGSMPLYKRFRTNYLKVTVVE